MDHLVALSQVGGIVVARMCSGCGEIFLEPTLGATTEEKGTILTDEFLHHLAKAYENEDGTLRPGIDRFVSHTSICFFGNRRDNYSACLTCAILGSVISGAGRFWGRGGLSGALIQNRPTFMGFLPVSDPISFSLISLRFSSHQRWAGRKCFCRRGP